MADEWRWADPKGQQRLLRTDDLRRALSAGTIAPNVPVWRKGWTGWKPANEVPELMESALSAENGSGKVAPPPSFVVAAQAELESDADKDGPDEPPPPPKYVPAPIVKKAPEAPIASPKPPPVPAASAKPPPVPPAKPPPVGSVGSAKPPPVAPSASAKPPPVAPSGKPAPVRAVSPAAASAKPPPLPAKRESVRPEAIDAGWGDDPRKSSRPPAAAQAVRTIIGVPAIPSELRNPPAVRTTLPVSPAPPPHPPPPHREPPKTPPPPTAGIQKHPTLIGLDNPMFESPPPPPSESPPIVAPAPTATAPGTPHAVTQPPPWEGSAEIAMPKMPPASIPKMSAPEPVEELSGSILLEDSQAGPAPKQREVELSSSDLLERESAVSVVKAPPLGVGAKASTLLGIAPAPVPMRDNAPAKTPAPPPIAESSVPLPEKTERELPKESPPGIPSFDLRALRTGAEKHVRALLEGPRPRLYVVGGVAAFALFLFFGLVVRLIVGSSEEETAVQSPSASVSAQPPKTSVPIVTAPPPSPVAPKLSSCSVAGDAHVVSPRALIGAGVEVVSVGDAIALGFASGPKEPMVATLDPATINATATTKLASANPVRRVTPTTSGGVIDSDVKTDAIKGRRAVGKWDLGASGTDLVWAARGSSDTTKIWALESDAAVEALRGVPTSDGIAIAYRHNGAIWVGAAKGDKLEAVGAPVKIAGLGPQVGSPAIAASDGNVLVAWADRADAADPWGLRLVAWRPGEAAKPAIAFKAPAGGLGEHMMAPALAALSGGKFLLVWTEGPVSNHQVRAQVLSPDGSPSGNPLTVSAEGVNAGQGQAAVLADGHGVVAFLAGSGKTFEVRATPLRCQ